MWFFWIPIGTRKTKCMSFVLVLWGRGHSLFLSQNCTPLFIPDRSSKAKGLCCCVWWVGDDVNPFPGTKYCLKLVCHKCQHSPSRVQVSIFNSLKCQVSIPNWPFFSFFFLFLFLFFLHTHTRKPTRVGFRVWWAFQLLIVFCVFETFWFALNKCFF